MTAGYRLSAIVAGTSEKRLPWTWWVNAVVAMHALPPKLRTRLYRWAGIDSDTKVYFAPGIHFRAERLTIGRGSTINTRCVFDNRARVTIGQFCGIGIGVHFITSHHDFDDPKCRAGAESVGEIVIGDGVWIGSGASLLPGVRVGDGAVIAAHAAVVRDVEPHTLVGGVPARHIRDLPTDGHAT